MRRLRIALQVLNISRYYVRHFESGRARKEKISANISGIFLRIQRVLTSQMMTWCDFFFSGSTRTANYISMSQHLFIMIQESLGRGYGRKSGRKRYEKIPPKPI